VETFTIHQEDTPHGPVWRLYSIIGSRVEPIQDYATRNAAIAELSQRKARQGA
jgi:hypothetical protein